MIWSSYIFDKKNKWISYNLWFIYINFYKVIFFFDLQEADNVIKLNCLGKNSFFILKNKKNSFFLTKTKPRFSYYIDLYCIEFFNHLILLNLYFFTTLNFYKNKNKKQSKLETNTKNFDHSITDHIEKYTSLEILKKNNVYRDFF